MANGAKLAWLRLPGWPNALHRSEARRPGHTVLPHGDERLDDPSPQTVWALCGRHALFIAVRPVTPGPVQRRHELFVHGYVVVSREPRARRGSWFLRRTRFGCDVRQPL